MATEKKRPRGLKGSAIAKANKKSKVEEPTELPENAQTVVIDKEVEEGDEVGEAAALFESALEKLDAADPSGALPLLRGTIHESDRILRNHQSENPLPSLFYYTYGLALYELGRLTDDEEFEPYLDAAEERLNDALEHDTELGNKIHIGLVKVWLAKASNAVSEDEQTIPKLATKALDKLNDETLANVPSKSIIELADIVLNHGELYDDLAACDKFRTWAENALEKVLKDEPNNANALSALGLSKLSLANYYLDHIDEEQNEDNLAKEEEKALQEFVHSKNYFESAKQELVKINQVTPQILSDLAEAYLNVANLTLKEDEQAEIYKKAVENIKEAKALIDEKKLEFSLPEALTSFLEEFEA
ncbi:nuclear pore complex subunit Nro1-domain-containing protein [Cokeromyces recurvatus]|uniref:nuclear pore complex subunit Nro1-domain-containing protein n=1 Tax=Cokeromyces recurvatus TaxID=90255 RepID=UPI002220F326|nr:nuclear pore complex subunit Nro1-domain-containing protein [Cokeromyces recurvatus]KAI7902335.1 nuclear pore complex subunit Nro1-domain-containing protein [Cokeromyces recurvatus]